MIQSLPDEIRACRLCTDRFSATETAHEPRPIVWFQPGAKVLVAGQAPGMRVHKSGKPFTDPSGDRLRDWMGVDGDVFYDLSKIAVVPMAFCFPGYDAKGSDLPPPPICSKTWHEHVMESLGTAQVTLLVGGYAHRWHMGAKAVQGGVTATVKRWRDHPPGVFTLPHPSWRNTGWLKKNPWFGDEVLPEMQAAIRKALQ